MDFWLVESFVRKYSKTKLGLPAVWATSRKLVAPPLPGIPRLASPTLLIHRGVRTLNEKPRKPPLADSKGP
jgi:hypothetical protein